MQEFLVSFNFHTVNDWILSGLTGEPIEVQQTSLYIRAADEDAALRWGQDVAATFMARINEDKVAGWSESGYTCWLEQDVASAGWEGAEGFLQTVHVGEYPDHERLSRDSFMDWLEQHGDFDA